MNMRRFIFLLIVCEFFSLTCIAANKTIKGHIVLYVKKLSPLGWLN